MSNPPFTAEQMVVVERCHAELTQVAVTPARFAAHYNQTNMAAGGKSTARVTMTYIGLLSVFLGIGTYIGMFWDDMDSFMRILLTAGLGVAMLNGTIILQRKGSWTEFLPGAYLISLFMLTGGLFVTLGELFSGNDVTAACILVFGTMLSASMLLYIVLRQPVMVFACLLFLNGLMTALCNEANLSWESAGLAVSLMNIVIGYGLHGKGFGRLGLLADLFGLGGLYLVAWDVLRSHDGINLLLLPLGVYGMWAGAKENNRLKLFLGVAQIFGTISYFTAEYFADTSSWPVYLILLGGVFIALGRQARKLLDKSAL